MCRTLVLHTLTYNKYDHWCGQFLNSGRNLIEQPLSSKTPPLMRHEDDCCWRVGEALHMHEAFVCCEGDVDLSLNICGNMDVLWARTRVTVGSWWSRENKKGKETACNSLWLQAQSPFCWAVEQFPPLFWNPSSAFLLKYADFLFTKNFPQLREQSERLYPKMNRCFTSYPFSEGPTSTTGRIDGTTS